MIAAMMTTSFKRKKIPPTVVIDLAEFIEYKAAKRAGAQAYNDGRPFCYDQSKAWMKAYRDECERQCRQNAETVRVVKHG